MPVLLCLLLVGLGVFGVIAASNTDAQYNRDVATGYATDAANGFQVGWAMRVIARAIIIMPEHTHTH